jgi:hypothetical protein
VGMDGNETTEIAIVEWERIGYKNRFKLVSEVLHAK